EITLEPRANHLIAQCLDAQAHPRERRFEVVRHTREHVRAIRYEALHASLRLLDRSAKRAHLTRPLRGHGRALRPTTQRFHFVPEPLERPRNAARRKVNTEADRWQQHQHRPEERRTMRL